MHCQLGGARYQIRQLRVVAAIHTIWTLGVDLLYALSSSSTIISQNHQHDQGCDEVLPNLSEQAAQY